MNRIEGIYKPGDIVFWITPYRDWFKGVVREQRGDLVLVDRIAPSGASGLLLETFQDEYGISALKPASLVDYAVWDIRT